jgi:hypothetical protein
MCGRHAHWQSVAHCRKVTVSVSRVTNCNEHCWRIAPCRYHLTKQIHEQNFVTSISLYMHCTCIPDQANPVCVLSMVVAVLFNYDSGRRGKQHMAVTLFYCPQSVFECSPLQRVCLQFDSPARSITVLYTLYSIRTSQETQSCVKF